MDEIIKHDEDQVPVKVKLASLPSVAQANVNLYDFKENLQQCVYDMRDIVTYKSYRFTDPKIVKNVQVTQISDKIYRSV